MQPQTQHPEFEGWQRLVGTWATEATHPGLPGIVVTGQATFEWLEDQRFLIQRSHYDHPAIPDALAVTGIIDGMPCMHYFDPRGVHRVFAVDITADTSRILERRGRILAAIHSYAQRRRQRDTGSGRALNR